MSDEKLRELERRFRETGSAEDEVAWLRTRARSGEKLYWESYSRLHELDVDAAADYLRWRVATGDLSQTRLELAAYCGHAPAGPAPNLPTLLPDLASSGDYAGLILGAIHRCWCIAKQTGSRTRCEQFTKHLIDWIGHRPLDPQLLLDAIPTGTAKGSPERALGAVALKAHLGLRGRQANRPEWSELAAQCEDLARAKQCAQPCTCERTCTWLLSTQTSESSQQP